jgi:hypothetical protein
MKFVFIATPFLDVDKDYSGLEMNRPHVETRLIATEAIFRLSICFALRAFA